MNAGPGGSSVAPIPPTIAASTDTGCLGMGCFTRHCTALDISSNSGDPRPASSVRNMHWILEPILPYPVSWQQTRSAFGARRVTKDHRLALH